MTTPRRFSAAGWTAAALLALAMGAGCTYPIATATPTAAPTPTPTATPTPQSAQFFMQSVGEDAGRYPVRYTSPGGEWSIAVPPKWIFNQQKDTGRELDSASETAGGAAVAAIYAVEKLPKDAGGQQALEAFVGSEWATDRAVEIAEQSDVAASSGAAGRKAAGTMTGGTGPGGRERFLLAAFAGNGSAFVLAFYPDRSTAPDALIADADAAVLSLRWEETRTRDVDKTNALQLIEAEPQTLDPAVATNGAGGIIGDLYSGLVSLDTSLNVQPELAERWDVTADGKTYTFHLRKDAQFHNGRPLTADDVVFSWLRAAGPEPASDTAVRYLGDILGVREYHAGTADRIAGLQIVDPYTIRVTLDAAKPFFIEKLSHPASWIVDRYTVRVPHWEFRPNGTGPFRMFQYVPEKSVILEADPGYYGPAPRLQYVVYWLTSTSQESLYKSGKIDRMDVAPSLLPVVNDPHDPLFGIPAKDPKFCTNFIMFNTALPPFDDPSTRKAFALSVNREVYVEVSPEEDDIPGGGVLPPGMPGYSAEPALHYYDSQAAKESIARSKYADAGNRPEMRLTVRSEAAEYDPTTEFLVDSWEDTLGWDILVEGTPGEAYEKATAGKSSAQLVFLRHCAELPDPDNFYNFLFHGDNATTYYGYRSPSLDALLDSASVEGNWVKRVALFRQADQILFDEAPAMALSYPGVRYAVWKPHIFGYVPTPIDVPQHHRMWIQRD